MIDDKASARFRYLYLVMDQGTGYSRYVIAVVITSISEQGSRSCSHVFIISTTSIDLILQPAAYLKALALHDTPFSSLTISVSH